MNFEIFNPNFSKFSYTSLITRDYSSRKKIDWCLSPKLQVPEFSGQFWPKNRKSAVTELL